MSQEKNGRTRWRERRHPRFDEPVYVTRPNLPPLEELQRALAAIFETKWLTNQGDFHNRLEARLAEYLQAEDCVLFCNGTQSLAALAACLGLSGEVVTTSFTFPATVHSLAMAGLRPVFADIEPDFYTLDAGRAAAAAGPAASAILAVHVYGNPCDIPGLEAAAGSKGLTLYFDSAHALGSRWGDRAIGSFGRAESFSFHATKLFNTFEGGAVASRDRGLSRELRLYRNFGIADEEHVVGLGTNAKMSEIHAAAGVLAMPGLPAVLAALAERRRAYQSALAGLPGLKRPQDRPGGSLNGQYYPVEIDAAEFGLTRDEVYLALKADRVFARKYFYPACHTLPAYRQLPSASAANLPVTERVAGRVLCLPIYATLPLEHVEIIAEILHAMHEDAEGVRAALAGAMAGAVAGEGAPAAAAKEEPR